jgi:REP element-mobilizing transposase RayT
MPAQLYLHITWTSLDRAPMIGLGVRRFLERFLPAEAQRHGAQTLALGMVSDHVHLVVEAPLRWDLPRLMMGLKGASSCEINKNTEISLVGLRWAKGYDVRTVGPGQLNRVIEYVRSQPARHPDRAVGDD